MSSKHSTNRRNELIGIGLFVLGALPLVLAALHQLQGESDDAENLARRVAAGLVLGYGAAPVMAVSLALTALGGMLFTGLNLKDPLRHAAGIVGVGAGLSVFLGALDPAWGGRLGAKVGGALATQSLALGLLAGGLLMVASVWAAWQRSEPIRRGGNAGQIRQESAPRSRVLADADRDGVSNLETSALVPDAATLEKMEELWRKPATEDLHPAGGSPYPDDVRRSGGIPEGARPLGQTPHAPTRRATPAPLDLKPGPQAKDAGPAPRRLVPDELAPGEALRRDAAAGSLEPGEIAELLADGPEWRRAAGEAEPAKGGEQRGALLRPAWEEAGDELLEDEPAAAVAEALQEGRRFEESEEEGEEEEEEEYSELDVLEDEEQSWELEDEAAEEAFAEAEDLDLEEVSEEAGRLAERAEEAPLPARIHAAELPWPTDDEPLEETVRADPASPLDSSTRTPDLFQEAPLTVPAAGSSRKKVPVGAGSSDSLLHEAGMLFLSEGRVAVSMLQRRFSLDFQAACDLLDELQEEGLIGPYKGGQQRDILLSVEEWQARVPAS